MKKKRIVIFGWAGSVHVQRWVKGLTERGYQIKVVSLGGKPIEGIETVILPGLSKFAYIRQARTAVREAEKFEPDIVHVHYAGGFGLWALRAKIKPMLISVWGSDIIDLPLNPFYKYLIKRILKKASFITATSKILKKTTLNLVPSAKEKIDVIPFGVKIPSTISNIPSLPPVKICFIKSHKLIYGLDILIKAMTNVIKEIPDITLNIAGEGEATDLIKKMIKELKLGDNINLTGFINNDDIITFIQKHHFMVMPSIKEAFGVAVLEASACGRPVIASNVGGVPEVLVDNRTGFLVPKGNVNKLAESIIKLANDVALMDKMGKAGYEFVKDNYCWEKSLDMMTELYERLLYEKK